MRGQTLRWMRDAGEYSAERLQALQQSTPVLPSKPRQEKEPAFKLSGSFKRATAAADDRFTTDKVRLADVSLSDGRWAVRVVGRHSARTVFDRATHRAARAIQHLPQVTHCKVHRAGFASGQASDCFGHQPQPRRAAAAAAAACCAACTVPDGRRRSHGCAVASRRELASCAARGRPRGSGQQSRSRRR